MSDAVTGAGGQAILTEIPEIFGAEHLLMARAADRDTFEAIERLVDGFKAYFTAHGEPVSENPSPGNIAGGLTTLEEKRSEEHTSELQSLMRISYAVFCLKTKKKKQRTNPDRNTAVITQNKINH